jgi:hypothetical protein
VSDNPSDNKKPVVIHTRVNEDLDAEIRRRAESLGVSVSNLVRNVLQHTFGLVGDIVADSKNIARSAKAGGSGATATPAPPGPGGAPAPGPTPAPVAAGPVAGWLEAVLAVNGICVTCNAILPKGSRAAVAVPAGNAFLCTACLKELEHATDE